MKMPSPDQTIITRRAELIHELKVFLEREQIVTDRSALRAYESDGLTAYQQLPLSTLR